MTEAAPAAEPTEAEAPAEPTEATEEASAEPTEAESAPEGKEPKEGEPEAKEEEISVSEAVKIKRKATRERQKADERLAKAEQMERTLVERERALREQHETWNKQVQPQLAELAALKKAARERRWGDAFGLLGADPVEALREHASELQDPEGASVRRELAELKRRESEREAQGKAERERQEKAAQERQYLEQTWGGVGDVVNVAPEKFPSLLKYQGEVGAEALASEFLVIQQQLRAAGQPHGYGAVARETERRARQHYGSAAPQTASPSQDQGQGKPGQPAAQANPTGRRPVGVPQRASAEVASEDDETDPVKLHARAVAQLREDRRRAG